MFAERVVLVTGGTGSFGQTLVRSLLDRGCGELRVFSRDETKQDAMRNALDALNVRYFIGDVRDMASLEKAVRGTDYIFHAAALKQVPSCEFFPMQAVLTNVHGSDNVIESGAKNGVKSIVCLSTDKAVYPINAMGMTKALMEKSVQAFARIEQASPTVVSCVRYGNVMYSRGSVIPLMIAQVRAGRKVTVTEPSMTRFMMALNEAVDLVEFAFGNAEPGDLFVRKAPACTIMDLAVAIRRLFASDVPISRIGMRHGEKLAETLVTKEEIRRAEDLGPYLRVRLDDRGLDYSKYFVEGDTEEAGASDYSSDCAQRLNVDEIISALVALPEVRSELADAGRPCELSEL